MFFTKFSMLSGVMLAVGSFGGDIGNLLAQWEQLGIFSYALPFLLIFALVFGILSKVDIFKGNKGVNAIIAIVVALMALQLDFVPRFFTELFPRVGVGLSIILAAIVLIGMFFSEKNTSKAMFGVAALIFIIVVIQSFGDLGTSSGTFLAENWPNLLIAALIIVAVIVVIGIGGGGGKDDESPFGKAIKTMNSK